MRNHRDPKSCPHRTRFSRFPTSSAEEDGIASWTVKPCCRESLKKSARSKLVLHETFGERLVNVENCFGSALRVARISHVSIFCITTMLSNVDVDVL